MGSRLAKQAFICFLKVCIARSAALAQWLCGGTSCQETFSFEKAVFKSVEH